jgi:hypothetical protein
MFNHHLHHHVRDAHGVHDARDVLASHYHYCNNEILVDNNTRLGLSCSTHDILALAHNIQLAVVSNILGAEHRNMDYPNLN